MTGLPAKYAKMGFAKGWKAFRAAKGKRKAKPAAAKKKTKKRKAKRKTSSITTKRKTVRKTSTVQRKKRRKGPTMPRKKMGKMNIAASLQDIGIGAAGAIGGSFAAKFIPIGDPRIKAAMPILLGILLGQFVKNPLAKKAGMGMSIYGAVNALKTIAPDMMTPLLSGDDIPTGITAGDVEQALIEGAITPAEAEVLLGECSPELLGNSAAFAGEEEDFAGEDEDEETDDYINGEFATTDSEL